MGVLKFELHIRPMIRAMDREHMLSRFDLWDYDQVVGHADELLTRLQVDMPTASSGGPWPPEWVDLFRRWKDTGFKHLELGRAELALSQAGTKFVMTANGTFPAPGYRGWLQLEGESETARTYNLYFDPPDQPATGSPSPFSFRERYAAADTRRVFVRDASGLQELRVTPAPPRIAALGEIDDLTFFAGPRD
jgi:hypothetical protein